MPQRRAGVNPLTGSRPRRLAGEVGFDSDPRTVAGEVDFGWDVAYWVSVVFFFLVIIPMVYFVWKYRARPGHKAQPSSSHNDVVETIFGEMLDLFPSAYFHVGADEVPSRTVLAGGALVLGGLGVNDLVGWRQRA